jgi:GrpB-like predicted nucleotidyltransferase (UPF0157 family)
MLGLSNKKVILVEYDEMWKEEYIREEQKLKKILRKFDIHYEHVGSTSVPGMISKPIIDVAIGVPDINTCYQVKDMLIDAGYYFREHAGDMDRLFITKGNENCRTHNIHIEIYGGDSWNNHILFKQQLISNPDYAKEYSRLKKILAQKYENNRLEYTKSKDEFIKGVLNNTYIH